MKAAPVVDAADHRRPATPGGPAGNGPEGPAGTRPSVRVAARPPADRFATMVRGFVELFLEVEAGRRPRAHLAPLLTPMLRARLCDVWVQGGIPGTVLNVHVVRQTSTVVDALVMVRRTERCGVVSLRLIRTRRGWLVDEVALPERGPLPLPAYPIAADDDDPDDDWRLLPRADEPPAPVPGQSGDWFAGATPG